MSLNFYPSFVAFSCSIVSFHLCVVISCHFRKTFTMLTNVPKQQRFPSFLPLSMSIRLHAVVIVSLALDSLEAIKSTISDDFCDFFYSFLNYLRPTLIIKIWIQQGYGYTNHLKAMVAD